MDSENTCGDSESKCGVSESTCGSEERMPAVHLSTMGVSCRRFIPQPQSFKANHSIYLDSWKIKQHRGCWTHGVDSRDKYYDVYLSYSHPDGDEIEGIVKNCAIGCGIATLIAAVIAGGSTASAAISAFVSCTTACVKGNVSGSFSCDIVVEDGGTTDWSGH